MQNRVYSEQFDDIYFSPEDGLAESEFVFLRGNDLPARWRGREQFTIAETGFGTGLNFLLTCKCFTETADKNAQLHYISFEKYPLSRDEIAAALECWRDELNPYLDDFINAYPLRVPGFHRVQLGHNIFLTLIFDDANKALPELIVPRGVDAWFLDGFAPAKNPDMWSDNVFAQMARLSANNATFATFTAAGFVKRGLRDAGFEVRKDVGYGRKRERLVGCFASDAPEQPENFPTKPRVAIIGGGLAGTSCAYVLEGLADVTIFEGADALASGASGNRVALCNPRFSAHRDENADFFTAAYAQAVRTLSALGAAVDYNRTTTLNLVTDEGKEKRFADVLQNWGWHEDHMSMMSAEVATDYAGVVLAHDALSLPDSFSINPHKLCNVYAAQADVRLNTSVTDLIRTGDQWLVNGEAFDAVILACGIGVLRFCDLDALELYKVRGQVSYISETPTSKGLKCNICYRGYLAPAQDGVHALGSTFTKWIDHTDILDDDHSENIERLSTVLPDIAAEAAPVNGWAGFRTSLPDRFPIIGGVPDRESWQNPKNLRSARTTAGNDLPYVYISAAHGSHGTIGSLAGAHMIADMLLQRPYSLSHDVVESLQVNRFLKRDKRKGRI